MGRLPLFRSAILLPPAAAAIVLTLAAARADPPAGNVARFCIAVAGGLVLTNLLAWVSRDGARFGREERLWAFVVFVSVSMGYYFAREGIAGREFDGLVRAQQRELAESATALSREIVAYVDGRARMAPPRPHAPATWDHDQAIWSDFERGTVDGYSQRFARRVRTTRAGLTFRNLRDRDLDAFYQQPGNAFQIRIVGERLGVLADRLQRAIAPAE